MPDGQTDGKIMLLLHTLTMRKSYVASFVEFRPVVFGGDRVMDGWRRSQYPITFLKKCGDKSSQWHDLIATAWPVLCIEEIFGLVFNFHPNINYIHLIKTYYKIFTRMHSLWHTIAKSPPSVYMLLIA